MIIGQKGRTRCMISTEPLRMLSGTTPLPLGLGHPQDKILELLPLPLLPEVRRLHSCNRLIIPLRLWLMRWLEGTINTFQAKGVEQIRYPPGGLEVSLLVFLVNLKRLLLLLEVLLEKALSVSVRAMPQWQDHRLRIPE